MTVLLAGPGEGSHGFAEGEEENDGRDVWRGGSGGG